MLTSFLYLISYDSTIKKVIKDSYTPNWNNMEEHIQFQSPVPVPSYCSLFILKQVEDNILYLKYIKNFTNIKQFQGIILHKNYFRITDQVFNTLPFSK